MIPAFLLHGYDFLVGLVFGAVATVVILACLARLMKNLRLSA